MNYPKLFSTDNDIKVCDVALFLKQDGALSSSCQYDKVNEIAPSSDGIIRKMIVRNDYRNHQKNVDRYATRSVRYLVLINPVDKLSLMKELVRAASIAYKETRH